MRHDTCSMMLLFLTPLLMRHGLGRSRRKYKVFTVRCLQFRSSGTSFEGDVVPPSPWSTVGFLAEPFVWPSKQTVHCRSPLHLHTSPPSPFLENGPVYSVLYLLNSLLCRPWNHCWSNHPLGRPFRGCANPEWCADHSSRDPRPAQGPTRRCLEWLS
ncbi:hypothetical protein HDV57DRAFT_500701 [Trichoderma longibrachiatum]